MGRPKDTGDTCRNGHPRSRTFINGRGDKRCNDCAAAAAARYKAKHPERYSAAVRRSNRRAIAGKYGLTPDDYDALVSQPCALCHTTSRKRLADHDHATGKLRGALCRPCNTALGALGDNAEGIRRALDYVS